MKGWLILPLEIRKNDLTENWYTQFMSLLFENELGMYCIYLLGKLVPLVERDIDKLRLLQL